jgi:hypothetical protein
MDEHYLVPIHKHRFQRKDAKDAKDAKNLLIKKTIEYLCVLRVSAVSLFVCGWTLVNIPWIQWIPWPFTKMGYK